MASKITRILGWAGFTGRIGRDADTDSASRTNDSLRLVSQYDIAAITLALDQQSQASFGIHFFDAIKWVTDRGNLSAAICRQKQLRLPRHCKNPRLAASFVQAKSKLLHHQLTPTLYRLLPLEQQQDDRQRRLLHPVQ